jgi:hypothetical protein
MEENEIINKNLFFYQSMKNNILTFYRLYIYCNLNETFIFNKFKYVINQLNYKNNIKFIIVEKEPVIFEGSNIYFLYNKQDNILVVMCSHKYYDSVKISKVNKLIMKTYNETIEYNDCISTKTISNEFELFFEKNTEIINSIKKHNIHNLHYILLDQVTDYIDSSFLFNNMFLDRNILISKYDYNPFNFNTINFTEYIQQTINAEIMLVVDLSRYVDNDMSNSFGLLTIKNNENVRDKIKSINKNNYKNYLDIIASLEFDLNKKYVFINSLKNMILPSFVNNINPLDCLYIKLLHIFKIQSFCIMPTDKENNTYVYCSQI